MPGKIRNAGVDCHADECVMRDFEAKCSWSGSLLVFTASIFWGGITLKYGVKHMAGA
jgi:hypothetical protein